MSGLETHSVAKSVWRRVPGAAIALGVMAAATGVAAFVLFQSATAVPVVRHVGQITLYVSDPNVDIEAEVAFYEDFIDEDDGGGARMGLHDARIIDVTVRAKRTRDSPRAVACALVFSYDSRLSRVQLHNADGMNSARGYRYTEDDSGGSGMHLFESSVVHKKFNLEETDEDGFGVMGRLAGTVSSSNGGLTHVRLPNFDSARTDEHHRFDDSFGIPGIWTGARSARFVVHVGPVDGGTAVNAVVPETKLVQDQVWGDPELRWTGRSVNGAVAMLTNEGDRQAANATAFLAGSLAGVAGGLLIEAMLRTRSFVRVEGQRPVRRRLPRRGSPAWSGRLRKARAAHRDR